MTINKFLMPVLAIVALLATVFGARLTGDWIVSGKDIPLGEMTPADLKGWMTLQNVSDGLGIPLAELYRLAGIPDGAAVTPDTAMKDLEKIVEGFETSVLRAATEAYLAGGPVSAAVETPAEPAPGETLVPTATAAPLAPETPHAPLGDGSGTGPTPLPAGQTLPAIDIKGRMTLKEIADQTGVPLARLLEALKLAPDTSASTQVKNLVEEGKIAEVQAIRDAVSLLQK